jgi:hypothetical protein
MRYAHLAPDFVRQEMVRTERERSTVDLARLEPTPADGGVSARAELDPGKRAIA